MQSELEAKTRRTFIKETVIYGAGLAALSSTKVLGANDRVRVGVIGVGGRANELMTCFNPGPNALWAGMPQFQIAPVTGAELVAVCDVYAPRLERAAIKVGPGARKFHDYRELLDEKDIDAVIVASPNHWHKKMLIDAVEAGKDVYVEKPCTHAIAEGPEEIRAVEKSGRMVQTGTQHHSWDHYIRGKEIVDSGALGEVRLVESYWFLNYAPMIAQMPQNKTDVSQLDWKAWLGAAPDQPFTEDKYRWWRYYWDFGEGSLTDLMVHSLDTIQWYMDSPTPSSAIATGQSYDYGWECPTTMTCTLEYPKGFLVSYIGSHSNWMDFGSIVFFGSKATLEISRASLAVYDEPSRFNYNSAIRRWRPDPKIYIESKVEGSTPNLQNWINSVRTRKTPNTNIHVGVEAARAGHLGNVAMRSGKKAKWDEATQSVILA
jgi:predicted dehydrogenase